MWIKICGMTTPEAGDAGAAEIGADVATRMSSALSRGHAGDVGAAAIGADGRARMSSALSQRHAGDVAAGLAPGEDAAHSVPGPGSKERN